MFAFRAPESVRGARATTTDAYSPVMYRDPEFGLRIVLALLGSVTAAWILWTTPRGYYLDLPSVVLAIASLYVALSAFIPAIRWPRR